MKKILIILCALGFIGFVGFFMFKNRPQGHDPIKIMNPTYFDNKGKIGRVLSRRFYTHLKDAQLIVLGSAPTLKKSSELWRELLKASFVDGIRFQVHSIKGLPDLTETDEFYNELSQIELGPGLNVIHVPADEIWRKKVEEAYAQADFIFFQAPFSMIPERQKQLGLDCQDSEDMSMACLASKAGTRYYRKKRDENRLTAMMEQAGINFYLIFIGEQY